MRNFIVSLVVVFLVSCGGSSSTSDGADIRYIGMWQSQDISYHQIGFTKTRYTIYVFDSELFSVSYTITGDNPWDVEAAGFAGHFVIELSGGVLTRTYDSGETYKFNRM